MAARKRQSSDYQSVLDAMNQVGEDEAYKIGKRDAKRGRAPILQHVYNRIVSTTDDDVTDDWSDEMRSAYLEGYRDGEIALYGPVERWKLR